MSGSGLRPFACRGTYFQLFDYSALSDEPDTVFAKTLTTQYGVAAIPVSVFYSSGLDERVIRLCFAKKTETLQAAALRLQQA
jgi:methionine aminotransferase